jgi:hypothetical protein
MTLIEILGFIVGVIGAIISVIISVHLDFGIIGILLITIVGFIGGWAVGIILARPLNSIISKRYNENIETKEKDYI